MKQTAPFLFLLLALSACSGFLMSKASWIGRVGMTFFYKEYNLLKVWWQGAMAVFVVMLFLFLLQSLLHRKSHIILSRLLHFLFLAAACAVIYITYLDFTGNFSHRILGQRFHYGIYLAETEWVLICLFFLFKRKTRKVVVTDSDKTELVKR